MCVYYLNGAQALDILVQHFDLVGGSVTLGTVASTLQLAATASSAGRCDGGHIETASRTAVPHRSSSATVAPIRGVAPRGGGGHHHIASRTPAARRRHNQPIACGGQFGGGIPPCSLLLILSSPQTLFTGLPKVLFACAV